MNKFVRWIKNHSKKKAKDLLDSWVQSVILSAIGAATVADHPISTIKEFISDLQTADHANIKILDIEHFNENEINVRRVTIVAQEDVNLFGWTMKTDARHSNDYDFGSILLSAGGIYDITDLGLGFFDYENETTLSIYNAQNQLVVEETIPPSTVDSHRILIRVIDADGNPIEDEPITIGGERAVREEQYKTNAEGEVIYGLTRRIPTDAFRREITIRDHSQYVGTDRGTRVVKFIITRDGSVKEACSN